MALNLEFFVSNGKEFFILPNKDFSDSNFFAKIAKEGDVLTFFTLNTKIEKCLNLELKNQSLRVYDYQLVKEDGTFASRRELCEKYMSLIRMNKRPRIMFNPVCGSCRGMVESASDIQSVLNYNICNSCWLKSLIPEKKNEKPDA